MRTSVEILTAALAGYLIGIALVALLLINPEPVGGLSFSEFYGRFCAGVMVFLYGLFRFLRWTNGIRGPISLS